MLEEQIRRDQNNHLSLFTCAMHLRNISVEINSDKLFLRLGEDPSPSEEGPTNVQLGFSRF